MLGGRSGIYVPGDVARVSEAKVCMAKYHWPGLGCLEDASSMLVGRGDLIRSNKK